MQSFKHLFIGGERVSPAVEQLLEIRSPHDGQLVGTVPAAGNADIDRAVAVARDAFDNGPWPRMAPAERIAILSRFAELHAAKADEYARFIVSENGSPLWFANAVQGGVAAQNSAFLQVAASYPWEARQAAFPAGNTVWRREAIGVVAAIIPWNAPHQSALAKLFPALLAGNTVILKLATETALDGQFLGELFVEAGLPAGVLSIVAADRGVSEHLVTHPGIAKVAFTGSTAAGKRIASLAGAQLKRVSLELGGKSAAIVLEDAEIDKILMGVIYGGFANSGQSCAASTRVLVPRHKHDAFVEALVGLAQTLRVGNPAEQDTFFGPQVTAGQQSRVSGYIASGIESGARLAMGGLGVPAGLEAGHYVRPTIFANVDNRMKIAQEEIFGPVMSVIAYDDVDDAVRIANDSDYGLSGGVWTADAAAGLAVARRVRTGTFSVNGAGPDFLAPFGGFKQSGIGREFGSAGIGEYVAHKSISI